ncbi:MAG: hypothetical protein KIS91_11180, partial [Anaerolineae bacterium]|nr:hypothetical protein [Anaerolineae bacterium]
VTPTPTNTATNTPTATPTAELSVDKVDTLVFDADLNGGASAGDTLRYTVTIKNISQTTAQNVIFTDTPDPITTLMVGSVTTTQGSIDLGNTAGNTSVKVAIGTMPPNGEVTITFKVLIGAVPPGVDHLVNQGHVMGDNLVDVSNDPDTPDPNDPTVTPLILDRVRLSLRAYCTETLGVGDPAIGSPVKRVLRRTTDGVAVASVFDPQSRVVGDLTAIDRLLKAQASTFVEDKPYTDPEAPFDPQHAQAPRRDSITWDPAILSELYSRDENLPLYTRIDSATNQNAAEKVWTRTWYECDHLDKDQDTSGSATTGDIRYPAIMQEWTYRFIEAGPWGDDVQPTQAVPGEAAFVFPVGMRAADLFGPDGNIATNDGGVGTVGYGLTSLDADFDGAPDIVHVDSEKTLYNRSRQGSLAGVALDLNNNRTLDGVDTDGLPLTGDELVVLSVDSRPLQVGQAAQFLDHVVVVESFTTSPPTVVLRVYWTGSLAPKDLGTVLLSAGDAVVANTNAPNQVVRAGGGNLCGSLGAWFAYVRSVDSVDGLVQLTVGRGLGATHTGMESLPNVPNTGPNPWYTKRFYVDGHEYNTVAVYTQGGSAAQASTGNCAYSGPPLADPSTFGFITLRSPTPKLDDVMNAQFSIIQDAYQPGDGLPMLPPFNYEHTLVSDVRPLTTFGLAATPPRYVGAIIGPVAPILQANQPLPYVTARGRVYDDVAATRFTFVEEARNPQFLGELTERYGQGPGTGGAEREFWYRQQFHTLPDAFTSFLLPDNPDSDTAPDRDLYLVATGWYAPQAQYRRYVQDITAPITTTGGRAKFCFDTAVDNNPTGTKIYKNADGIRVYGRDNEGAGNTTPRTSTAPAGAAAAYLEVPPYTEVTSIFDPQSPQAPVKDLLTLNPAYMNEFRHGGEPLSVAYGQISLAGVGGSDGGEKVFPRLWYEPRYIDTAFTAVVSPTGAVSPTRMLAYPAVQQEMTYMLLDPNDQPAPTGPGGRFLFPVATGAQELPRPLTTDPNQFAGVQSFGYGLTSFDADFDGRPGVVRIETEQSLNAMTGIGADFNANGGLDDFDPSNSPLSGDEMVVLMDDGVLLDRGDPTRQSAQFLDHLVQLENVSYNQGTVTLRLWWTGGGLHPVGPGLYSKYPDSVGTITLSPGDMILVNRTQITKLGPGQNNFGQAKGAWFAYVQAIGAPIPGQSRLEGVVLSVGRALGGASATMYDGSGNLNLTAPTPWYLKRFFVDGHEYNVSAVLTAPLASGGEGFKAITIRTPIPKEADVVNTPQSLVLQGYLQDLQFGVDTSEMYVMPPFNVRHTIREDIRPITDAEFAQTPTNPDLARCLGPWRGVDPLTARLNSEAVEPRFFGELRELPYQRPATGPAVWSVEQFHILPDHFTDIGFPRGQYYLLTSDWTSDRSRLAYRGCDATYGTQTALNGAMPAIPAPTDAAGTYFQASTQQPVRLQFWYLPGDPVDIYINQGALYQLSGKLSLQGRQDRSGARVVVGSAEAGTEADGSFHLLVPPGQHAVEARRPGYLPSQTTVNVGWGQGSVSLPPTLLQAGDTRRDNVVNLFDLVIVAANYGLRVPPADSRADINGDGQVGLIDLVLVGANYGKRGPTAWGAPPSKAEAKAATARISLDAPTLVKAGEEFTVVVRASDAAGLGGADVRLRFDPKQLAVVPVGDSPAQPGAILDPAASFVARNQAADGAVTFTAARLGNAVGAADGELFSVRLRALADGKPDVSLSDVTLAGSDGEALLTK